MTEILENIVEDDKRAASILSSIRSMLKLEKREKEKTNLNSLIEEIVNIFNREAIEKNINLNVNLAENPVYIMADRIQVQQVLLNFLTNAALEIIYSKPGKKSIFITELLQDGLVTVSVRDTGNGFDEANKEKLFKPFMTTRKEGLGIGLAISQSIIDNHGGKIWAENIPGGGAKFSFSLKSINDDQ